MYAEGRGGHWAASSGRRAWLTWRGGPGDRAAAGVVVEGGGAREDGGALVVARLHGHLVDLALL